MHYVPQMSVTTSDKNAKLKAKLNAPVPLSAILTEYGAKLTASEASRFSHILRYAIRTAAWVQCLNGYKCMVCDTGDDFIVWSIMPSLSSSWVPRK